MNFENTTTKIVGFIFGILLGLIIGSVLINHFFSDNSDELYLQYKIGLFDGYKMFQEESLNDRIIITNNETQEYICTVGVDCICGKIVIEKQGKR